jgi:hypothetical protein
MLHFFKANIDRKGSLAITANEALNTAIFVMPYAIFL